MKLTINSRVLKVALESTAKAINQKATIPALANFLLEGDGAYITITVSDGNTTIKEIIPCETEGKALLPTNLLELVRTLPDEDITIETEANTATILWKNGKSTLPTFEQMEYPVIPQYDGKYTAIKGEIIAEALAFTLPHTANDDLRPIINGVFFNGKEGTIDFVASDMHTLALYKAASDHKEPFNFVLDKAAARLVLDKAKNADAEFAADTKNIFFHIGNTTIISRKIEGKFPNYESIIPARFNSSLTMDKRQLVNSIKRVSVCSNKATGHIKFSFGMLESQVEAQDLSMQTSARQILEDAAYEGAELTIGFKDELIIKSLLATSGNEVKINFNDAGKAAVIKGDNEAELTLVMPVQIQ